MATISIALLLAASVVPTAQLKPETLSAFQLHATAIEARIKQQESTPATFLSIQSKDAEARARQGEIIVEKAEDSPLHVRDGLIHHWTGAAFVPGATVAQAIAFMQDYNDLSHYYQPEVVGSKLRSRHGDDFEVELTLRKHQVITVTLDTVSQVRYGGLDPAHQWSHSHMDRISEADGADHGFLWRMDTYWRFQQAPGGVLLECEVVTLTRDIPSGLGWAVNPFVSSIPKESLEFTLEKTRAGILAANHNHQQEIAWQH